MIKNEEKELRNKIDLAYNILELYYKKTRPEYIENVVKKGLVAHQEQLFHQLNNIYNIYKTKETSKELKKRLLDIVKYSRYSNNGYFWVNDMHYKMIMHPIKPEYDNKIFVDTPLVPFVQLSVDTLQKEKKDAVYIKYQFYNPATKKYEFKVSLVKVFQPYGWVIGTGKYISDVTSMIQLRALKDIEALRYGESGYFWVNDMNYKMIMHPIKPEYNNNVFIDTPDVPFVELGVDALKNSTKDTAIIRYVFHNPATGKYEDKLSVVKVFKPWNWVLGTGVYINSIKKSIEIIKNNKHKEENHLIIKILITSIFIILIVLVFTYYLVGQFIIKPMLSLNNEKKHFEEIAQVDFLTNILNRRAFNREIDKYFSYAKRHNLRVSVMMIDIDFFKKVNDTYGHDAGDRVLQTLSKVVRECIREEDIFGRLGGEEFGICILNSTPEVLYRIANKIRSNVEKREILYKDQVIKITISIGCYNVHIDSENFTVSLNKADKALYEAKNRGRNKVIIYNEEIEQSN
jgi:methyl-accepting chemotaxis protein